MELLDEYIEANEAHKQASDHLKKLVSNIKAIHKALRAPRYAMPSGGTKNFNPEWYEEDVDAAKIQKGMVPTFEEIEDALYEWRISHLRMHKTWNAIPDKYRGSVTAPPSLYLHS